MTVILIFPEISMFKLLLSIAASLASGSAEPFSYFFLTPKQFIMGGFSEDFIRSRIDEVLAPVRDVESSTGLTVDHIQTIQTAIDSLQGFLDVLDTQKKDSSKIRVHLTRLETQLVELSVRNMRVECSLTPAQLSGLPYPDLLKFEETLKEHQKAISSLPTTRIGARARDLLERGERFLTVILERVSEIDPIRDIRLKIAEFGALARDFSDTPDNWDHLTKLVTALSRRCRSAPVEARPYVQTVYILFLENRRLFEIWSTRNYEDEVLTVHSEGRGLALIVNQETELLKFAALLLLPPLNLKKLQDVYMMIETSRIVQYVASGHYPAAMEALKGVQAAMHDLETAADRIAL